MADIVKLIYKGDEMAQGGGSGSAPQATTEVIGTVRGATSTEVNNASETGSQWELLIMNPNQIKWADKNLRLESTELNVSNTATWAAGTRNEISYSFPRDWFALLEWDEEVKDWYVQNDLDWNDTYYFVASASDVSQRLTVSISWTNYGLNGSFKKKTLVAVSSWSKTFWLRHLDEEITTTFKLTRFFYYK